MSAVLPGWLSWPWLLVWFGFGAFRTQRSIRDAIQDKGRTDAAEFVDPVEQPWYGRMGFKEPISLREVWRRRARTGSFRRLVRGILFSPSEIVIPHLYYDFTRQYHGDISEPRTSIAEQLFRPVELLISKRVALSTLLLLLWSAISGLHWYFSLALYWLLLANICREIATVISGASLTDRLRHSLGSPVANFARIAFTDLLTLIVAGALITAHPARSSGLRWGWFPQQVREIITLHHISAFLHLRSANLSTWVVAIASLTFYSLVLTQARRPSAFRRTNHDRVSTALALLHHGAANAAMEVIGPLSDLPAQDTENAVALGGLALTAGDWEQSLKHAWTVAHFRRPWLDDAAQRDDAITLLVRWFDEFPVSAAPGLIPLHIADAQEMLDFALSHQISDGAFVSIMDEPDFVEGTRLDHASTTLDEQAKRDLNNRLVDQLDDRVLSRAAIAAALGQFAAAEDTLSGASPSLPLDQLVRELEGAVLPLRRAFYESPPPKRVDALPEIAKVAGDAATQVVTLASRWNPETLPGWLCYWLSNRIQLVRRCESGKGERDKELDSIRSSLIGQLAVMQGDDGVAAKLDLKW
jgi:hypothetical protein